MSTTPSYDQKKMMQTRADLIGCKPRVLAARIKRRLKTIRSQLEGIGAAFEDIDMTVVGEGQSLLDALDEYEKTVEASVEWLQEAANYQ